MILYPVKWQLRVSPNGERIIYLHVVPGARTVIEQIGMNIGMHEESKQRCFIADPNSLYTKRLSERLQSSEPVRAAIGDIYCMLCEELNTPVAPAAREAKAEPVDRPPHALGVASPRMPGLTVYSSTQAIDELIRQESLGRRIDYIASDIDGLEPTTKENNEDGLVEYRWPCRALDGTLLKFAVRTFDLHYHESPVYQSPSGPESQVISRAELTTFDQLVEQFKSIRHLLQGLGALLIIIIVLIWSR
jgi:hypothetical protein